MEEKNKQKRTAIEGGSLICRRGLTSAWDWLRASGLAEGRVERAERENLAWKEAKGICLSGAELRNSAYWPNPTEWGCTWRPGTQVLFLKKQPFLQSVLTHNTSNRITGGVLIWIRDNQMHQMLELKGFSRTPLELDEWTQTQTGHVSSWFYRRARTEPQASPLQADILLLQHVCQSQGPTHGSLKLVFVAQSFGELLKSNSSITGPNLEDEVTASRITETERRITPALTQYHSLESSATVINWAHSVSMCKILPDHRVSMTKTCNLIAALLNSGQAPCGCSVNSWK